MGDVRVKFIDWFAGIGGFRRGMELAGHEYGKVFSFKGGVIPITGVMTQSGIFTYPKVFQFPKEEEV